MAPKEEEIAQRGELNQIGSSSFSATGDPLEVTLATLETEQLCPALRVFGVPPWQLVFYLLLHTSFTFTLSHLFAFLKLTEGFQKLFWKDIVTPAIFNTTVAAPYKTAMIESGELMNSWWVLCDLGNPILLAILLSRSFRRVARALDQNFPLRQHMTALFEGPQVKKSSLWNFQQAEVYIDIRQSLFKQYEVIWSCLSPPLLLISCLVGWRFIQYWGLTSGPSISSPSELSVNPNSSTVLFLAIALSLFMVHGALANLSAEAGWDVFRETFAVPKLYFNSRVHRLIFEGITVLRPLEFRVSILGAKIATGSAVVASFAALVALYRFSSHVASGLT